MRNNGPMMSLDIGPDVATTPDVHELLEVHLAFARSVTPPEDVFALDPVARLDERLFEPVLECLYHGDDLGRVR